MEEQMNNGLEKEKQTIGAGLLPKKPSKGSIIESIDTTTNGMAVIATLKEAIADYLHLPDMYDYEDNPFVLILGRLEMGLIERKQSLDEDQKAFSELKDE